MSRTRMIASPFIVFELCQFDYFSKHSCTRYSNRLGIYSGNYIRMCIRSGWHAAYNND